MATRHPAINKQGLRREIGLFQLVAYGVGNIVGAGVYVLVGEAAGLAGGMIWLTFLAGAIIALFTGLSYAELGAMYPRAASEYVFLGRAYGSRLLSFMASWTMILTESVAAAAISLGFAGYMYGLTGLPRFPVAIGVLAAIAALVLVGIRDSIRVNTVLSIIAIGGLAAVVGMWISGAGDRPADVTFTQSPMGLGGVIAAMTLVFFAYIGFDNITNVAEEVKNPQRVIPRGLLLSVAISTVLYVLVGFAVIGLAGHEALADSEAPLAYAASRVLGGRAYDVLSVIAMLTTFNTALVLSIASSRMIYGMGRGGVLPPVLSKVAKGSGAPWIAVLSIFAISAAFLSLGSIGEVANVTSFGSLITFALVNLAMVHLRRVAPRHERPFRAPLSIGWLSITGLLGVVSCIALMTQFNWFSALLGLLLPGSGALVYWLYGRRQLRAETEPLHEPHEPGTWEWPDWD